MSFRDRIRAMVASEGGGPKPVALRGRISKMSITRGGRVSVVVTFGIDEPLARMLDQGALVELLEIAKAPVKPPKPKPGEIILKEPGEL